MSSNSVGQVPDTRRRRTRRHVLAAGAGALCVSTCAVAQSDLVTAVKGGRPLLHMHYRIELVDDEANDLDDASASTLRTAFGYQTGEFFGFSARILAENVLHVFADDFTVPGDTPNPTNDIVADPEGTEVDEAFLQYTGLPDTRIRVGRQYLTYRKAPLHRFIGTVPWRQNWQSMDAVAVTNTSIPNLTANYAYVHNVNRIFGENNPNPNLADSPMSSHFINLQYSGLPIGSLEGFYYRLDYDNDSLPAPFTDRQTIGFKLQGSREVSTGLKALYLAEYSHQTDIAENATAFESANQYHLAGGFSYDLKSPIATGLTLKVGYEVLESDNGISFSTPLATVHAFQGFADRFIGFPGGGVEDLYVLGKTKLPFGLNLFARYHDFSIEASDADYGSEIDFQLTKKIDKFTFALKHATFFGDEATEAGNIGIDKSVTWFFVDFVM